MSDRECVLSGDQYDEGYFETGLRSNYFGYRWRPDLVGPRLIAIIEAAAIAPPAPVLDFGCAKGFYVRWLRLHGFNAIGIDISQYAIAAAPSDVAKWVFMTEERPLGSFSDLAFSLSIAKDVLEHLQDVDAVSRTIAELRRVSKKVFVTVPIARPNRIYANIDDEKDTTHRIRLTLNEWGRLLGVEPNWPLCKSIKGDNADGTYCTIIAPS